MMEQKLTFNMYCKKHSDVMYHIKRSMTPQKDENNLNTIHYVFIL